MTGKRALGHRVALLDAYAGAGVYEDGAPGSPALAAEVADKLGRIRNLEGYFVEADERSYRTLCQTLAGKPNLHTYPGRIEDHLQVVMKEVGEAPLFAFFDPFGLTVPFDLLVNEVLARSLRTGPGGPPTEMLINFSLPGLRRNAGKKKVPGARKRLDAVLDGGWWREIWDSGAQDRQSHIILGYVERLRDASGGWGAATIPVRSRWDGPVVYCLILLTRYSPALWRLNEAVSSAMEEFREFCHQVEGRLDLEPLEEREEGWQSQVVANLERLLAERGSFVVGREIREVYAGVLWHAREKHVRRAIKDLHAAGKIKTDGKGEVERMLIVPTD
jgi:three-Cys-motif partner protein